MHSGDEEKDAAASLGAKGGQGATDETLAQAAAPLKIAGIEIECAVPDDPKNALGARGCSSETDPQPLQCGHAYA